MCIEVDTSSQEAGAGWSMVGVCWSATRNRIHILDPAVEDILRSTTESKDIVNMVYL